MTVKNYYLVLGVPRDESAPGIRRAYRSLAKRYHPDHGGESQAPAFREIAEAYDVLSDPERRSAHNRELARDEASRAGTTAVSSRGPTVEPLAGWPRRARAARKPSSLIGVPWVGPGRPLTLVVALSPSEAARGTTIRAGIPIQLACRECHGGRWARWSVTLAKVRARRRPSSRRPCRSHRDSSRAPSSTNG